MPPRLGQFPVQLLPLGVLVEVGGDHLQDLVAQPFELTRGEVGGLGDQVGLGLGQQLCAHLRRAARRARW